MKQMNWKSGLAIAVIALSALACDVGGLLGSGSNTSGSSAATQQTVEAEVQRRVQQTAQAVKPNTAPTTAPVPPTSAPTSAPISAPTTERIPAAPTTAPVATRPPASPIAPAQNRRLNNGTVVKRSPGWSAGAESYVVFTNPQAVDAVAVLTKNDVLGIAVYVRAGESYKLESVETGNYGFWYVMGEDWDAANARFTRNAEYHKFILPMTFTRTLNPTTSTYTYTYWNAPLTAGNADAEQPVINANEFPNLK
ncbi:MAG: hypothetical protein HZC40_26795 [Chloroflexi bacterium]|nr:hypothetical protein [Chloroflexota bacterium]